MPCAETENISSRVNVTIMLNTTFNTLPVSYRKSSCSLRPAPASAFGARSRGIGFIDFSVDNTGLPALVVEHCLEAGPYLDVRTCKEDLPVLPVSCPSLERHPSQRAFIAKTLAPPELATLCQVAFAGVVFGRFLNRTAANVLELLRRSHRVSREVESGHPPTTLPNHTIRQVVAVVPYLIDFSRHAAQKRRVAIFYPDFENLDAC